MKDAAVREGRVCGRELQWGHREALAERGGADVHRIPLRERPQRTGLLAIEVDAGPLPEPERPERGVKSLSA